MKQLVFHGQDLQKDFISEDFSKICREIQVSAKSDTNTGTLLEELCTFMIISRWILLGMRDVSNKSCRENQNTHFMLNNFFFRKSCRLWDNVEKYGTIWRMRFACWIIKATGTHSEYVILITFTWQKWLRERDSMLRYSKLPVFLLLDYGTKTFVT
jgi:hypothetical protein